MAVGAFGTLVGAGGGFVLVPILLLIHPDREPSTITATALFVVLANAVSGSFAYGRQRRIDYVSGGWFALATLPGAVAGAVVVGFIPRRAFDAIFAVVMISIGVFLALRSDRRGLVDPVSGWSTVRRELTDSDGNTWVYSYRLWQGVAISTGVGFVAALLGIGGGIMHVPIMATLLHFPVHVATATSQFVLAFMSGQATAVHIASGNFGWDSALLEAVLLSIGAIPGAQLGALLARRLKSRAILRALAVALVLVGIRLGLVAAGY